MLGFVVSGGLIVLWLEVESIWYNCHRNDDFTNTDTEYKGMKSVSFYTFYCYFQQKQHSTFKFGNILKLNSILFQCLNCSIFKFMKILVKTIAPQRYYCFRRTLSNRCISCSTTEHIKIPITNSGPIFWVIAPICRHKIGL